MRYAVGFRNRNSTCSTSLGELETQTALADARFAHNAHGLKLAPLSPFERRFEGGHFVPTSDELREAARPRELQSGAHRAGALELIHRESFADSSKLESAEIPNVEVPMGELCRMLRQVGVSRRCELFHARRQPYGVTLRRVVHPQIVPDLSHDDLARIPSSAAAPREGEAPHSRPAAHGPRVRSEPRREP